MICVRQLHADLAQRKQFEKKKKKDYKGYQVYYQSFGPKSIFLSYDRNNISKAVILKRF